MQRVAGSRDWVRILRAGNGLVVLLFLVAAVLPAGAQEIGWPRVLESSGNRIEVFQPQVQSWRSGKLDACVAVDVAGPESKEAVYGVVWFSARTSVDEAQRRVTVYDLEVTKAEFPSDAASESNYTAMASQAVRQWTFSIALDRLLADMASSQSQTAGAVALNATPPRIYIRENPTVLILIDGNPVLRRVENSDLLRVINTPALIVIDPKTNTYFLRGDSYWMTAGTLNGPWRQAANPPASLDALLTEEPQAAPGAAPQQPPEVIVSTVAAELIQFQGRPQFSPILETQLLYVTNTDSDLFLRIPERQYYVLLSGRWLRAQNLDGPWQFVPGSDLPPDFVKIPPDHPKAGVLASVPGTQQAKDALAAAEVPQTATVNRKLATFTATYDGEPRFVPIEGTDLAYAVNSPDNVIRLGDRYYAVSNGIWFVANTPTGPWIVCDSVPQEIYTIPPSSPVYPVTYVYVYDSTPDYVYVGYLPGYFGVYIWDGLVVYGTGYFYPCWAGFYYFGWPWTWGFGFHYTYWGGGFYWRPWYHPGWYWRHPWHRGPGPWLKAGTRVQSQPPCRLVAFTTAGNRRRSPAIRRSLCVRNLGTASRSKSRHSAPCRKRPMFMEDPEAASTCIAPTAGIVATEARGGRCPLRPDAPLLRDSTPHRRAELPQLLLRPDLLRQRPRRPERLRPKRPHPEQLHQHMLRQGPPRRGPLRRAQDLHTNRSSNNSTGSVRRAAKARISLVSSRDKDRLQVVRPRGRPITRRACFRHLQLLVPYWGHVFASAR
jgi:hypothetical protein